MVAKPKFHTLVTDQQSPALAAAGLALTILKSTNCSSIADLAQRLEAGDALLTAKTEALILTSEQMALIEAEHEVVAMVRIGPTVFVAECDGCHRTLAVLAQPPRTCGTTVGCKGVLHKSVAAKRVPFTPVEAA